MAPTAQSVRAKCRHARSASDGGIHRLYQPSGEHAKESRPSVAELEQHAKRVFEATGSKVETRHTKSVIMGIIDPDILKHCAQ